MIGWLLSKLVGASGYSDPNVAMFEALGELGLTDQSRVGHTATDNYGTYGGREAVLMTRFQGSERYGRVIETRPWMSAETVEWANRRSEFALKHNMADSAMQYRWVVFLDAPGTVEAAASRVEKIGSKLRRGVWASGDTGVFERPEVVERMNAAQWHGIEVHAVAVEVVWAPKMAEYGRFATPVAKFKAFNQAALDLATAIADALR